MLYIIYYYLLCIIFYLQHNHLIPKFVVVIIISNHCWSLRVVCEIGNVFQCKVKGCVQESESNGEDKMICCMFFPRLGKREKESFPYTKGEQYLYHGRYKCKYFLDPHTHKIQSQSFSSFSELFVSRRYRFIVSRTFISLLLFCNIIIINIKKIGQTMKVESHFEWHLKNKIFHKSV